MPTSKCGKLAHAVTNAVTDAPKRRKPVAFDSSDPRQMRAAAIRRFLAKEPPCTPEVEALRAELTAITRELSGC